MDPSLAVDSRVSRSVCLARRAAALAFSATLLAAAPAAQARLVTVGTGGTFATVEAAINGRTYGPGDSITILPGTHQVASMLRPLGSGTAGSPIVVRGAGAGISIVSGALLSNHKALWDVEQSNSWWVFEDLTVSDMRGAQTNARGFFLVGCADLLIQRCEVTNCWNGFMSAGTARRVTIQFCDIHDNGGLQGPAHNLYLSGGEDFVVQHNWIHDAHYGTCFKDRTKNLRLQYNRIENADLGGYEVSLAGSGSADRGETLLLGNVIVKSATSAQRTHFLRFEDGRLGTLKLVNNTMVGRSSCTVVYSIASLTTLRNNVFHIGAKLFARDTSARLLTGAGNWATSGMTLPAELAGTPTGSEPGFVDLVGGDLQLAAGSPCIDAGDGAAPLPEWQYEDEASRTARAVQGAAVDVGAFESDGAPAEPDTTAPAAPTDLVATATRFDRIDLEWSAPADADIAGYRIERAADAAGPFVEIATETGTAFEDEDLASETTLWYRVLAVDAAANVSEPSAADSATTPADLPPAAPTDLAATATSATRIFLSWTAPADQDLEDFVVLRSATASGPFETIGSTSSASYSSTGLLPETRWWFQVCARDGAGHVSDPSAAASDSTPAAAALGATVVQGTLLSGSGADLGADDGVDLEVRSAGPRRKQVAEIIVSGTVAVDASPELTIDYDAGASVTKSALKVWIWRWATARWQKVDNCKLGPTDIARTIRIEEKAARYVSASGEVRLRFLVSRSAAFLVGLDAVAMERGAVAAARSADPPGHGATIPNDADQPAEDAGPVLALYGPAGGSVRFAVRGEPRGGLHLYDVRGRVVAVVASARPEGARQVYTWDGRDAGGRAVGRGIYFARVVLPEGTHVRRLVWLRE